MRCGPALEFEVLARVAGEHARAGIVTTPHGLFETPAFMPVGTRGTIKGILPGLVGATGAQCVLANTYHLLLRPGPELVERRGGVHALMNWRGPILTDSGGYQAYSLADMNRVSDDGVVFRSVVDGSEIALSPERAIRVQNQLGADIIMAFDDCPPSVDPATEEVTQPRLLAAAQRDSKSTPASAGGRSARPKSPVYAHAERLRVSNERTVRWLERCKAEHAASGGIERRSLFGIVQGGTDLSQRTWSAERITQIELPGYAIGGVAVGERSEQIAEVVRHTAPLLPVDKPRYLMGVGYERDLLAAVRAGVDMFDCVLPTRNGRNANAFTSRGQIRLRNSKFAEDDRPIEPGCDCPACDPARCGWAAWAGTVRVSGENGGGFVTRREPRETGPFTRAYLRHLFQVDEMLGPILVSLHNLRHFQRFMEDVRETIRHAGGRTSKTGAGSFVESGADWAGLLSRWPVAAPGFSGAATGE